MTRRISAIVYATLTLLAVAAAATAKGYADTLGEFNFILIVSAVGLVVAHFWSATLAERLARPDDLSADWFKHEAIDSSVMAFPAVLMLVVTDIMGILTDFEVAVTVGMSVVVALLFAYTWLGSRHRHVGTKSSLMWALGTAGVGILTIAFKVIA